MDKFLLGLLFVLTLVLALVGLNDLQNLSLSVNEEIPSHFWQLTALAYGSAITSFISGLGLALLCR